MEPDPNGGLGDADEDEEDTTVTSVADDTSTNPPPARRACFSSRVPPIRGGTSGRNNNPHVIKTNEGTVICPFIFYKYEEVTPIRREIHTCWKVPCVSGTDAQG